jgi:hypothetical protein
VPISPTELNYQGQNLKIDTKDINILRHLTDGEYGPLFITDVNGQSNTPMSVKV